MDAWCFLKISKALNHHVENYLNHNIKDLHHNIRFYVIITINMYSILHKSHPIGTYGNSWGEAQLWLIEGAGVQWRMYELYLKINKMKLNFFP